MFIQCPAQLKECVQPDIPLTYYLQVGLIMYFVRTPCEWGMDAISATLTFLWEVVGYVEGLFFKDLKQTMKKEQCEVKLLVTASMPGIRNKSLSLLHFKVSSPLYQKGDTSEQDKKNTCYKWLHILRQFFFS